MGSPASHTDTDSLSGPCTFRRTPDCTQSRKMGMLLDTNGIERDGGRHQKTQHIIEMLINQSRTSRGVWKQIGIDVLKDLTSPC